VTGDDVARREIVRQGPGAGRHDETFQAGVAQSEVPAVPHERPALDPRVATVDALDPAPPDAASIEDLRRVVDRAS
jgi:hypothetical protein